MTNIVPLSEEAAASIGATIAAHRPAARRPAASYHLAARALIAAAREAGVELAAARRFDAALATVDAIGAALKRMRGAAYGLYGAKAGDEDVLLVSVGYEAQRDIKAEIEKQTEGCAPAEAVLGVFMTSEDCRAATGNLGAPKLTAIRVDGRREPLTCLSQIVDMADIAAFLDEEGRDVSATIAAALIHAWAVSRLHDGDELECGEVCAWGDLHIPSFQALPIDWIERTLSDAWEVFEEQRAESAAQIETRV